MKFGLFMMPEHPPGQNVTLAFERDFEQIELAERLGFDEVWIGEHHSGGWEIVPAPEIMLAKAAALTRRITLATGVISLPYHHPVNVAERACFLDHIIPGRFILGLGAGGLNSDQVHFGVRPEETRPMMRESIEIITRLLQSPEPVTYRGEYWQVENVRLQVGSYQKPHMPLAVAGLTTLGSYQIAGEKGMIPLSIEFSNPRVLASQWEATEASARRAGRPASRKDWRIAREVYVAESSEQARREIAEGASRSYFDYFRSIGLLPLIKETPEMPDEEVTLDYMIDRLPWIVGDPDECARRIRQLSADVGGFGSLLIVGHDWTSKEKWFKSLELFSRFVIPQLR